MADSKAINTMKDLKIEKLVVSQLPDRFSLVVAPPRSSPLVRRPRSRSSLVPPASLAVSCQQQDRNEGVHCVSHGSGLHAVRAHRLHTAAAPAHRQERALVGHGRRSATATACDSVSQA